MGTVMALGGIAEASSRTPSLDGLISQRRVWRGQATASPPGIEHATGWPALDAVLPARGWPGSALSEILLPADGVGELQLLWPTLARLSQSRDGLHRAGRAAFPSLSAGMARRRCPARRAAGHRAKTPRDALWATEQCLRSGACNAVLCWPQQADDRALRRLQVAAETGQALGFRLPSDEGRGESIAGSVAHRARCIAAAAARAEVPWRDSAGTGDSVPAARTLRAVTAIARAGNCFRDASHPSPGQARRPRIHAANASHARRHRGMTDALGLPAAAATGARRRPPPPSRSRSAAGTDQRPVAAARAACGQSRGTRAGLAAGHAAGGRAGAGQRCFATVEHDPLDAERWRRFLAAWAYRFSSQVSTDLPHALVLEVGHSLQLFGPWPRLEAQLREELRELGFRHRIVAAPNPLAARVLANVHDGLAVGDSTLLNALGQLPVERAGLSPDVARCALAHGPAQAAAGVRPAARRVGAAVPARSAAAPRSPAWRGRTAGLVPAAGCVRGPHRIRTRSRIHQALLFPLRRLVNDLAAYLAGRDGGVQRFALVLEHERIAPQRGRGRAAGAPNASRRCCSSWRAAGWSRHSPGAGARHATGGARTAAFVPAGRDLFDSVRSRPCPGRAARTPARAAGR